MMGKDSSWLLRMEILSTPCLLTEEAGTDCDFNTLLRFFPHYSEGFFVCLDDLGFSWMISERRFDDCVHFSIYIYFFSTYPLLTALNFLMETCWWYAVKVMEDFTKSEWLQRRWRPDILLWDGIIQDSLGALYFFFRLTYPLNSLSNSFICYVQGDPFPRQEQNAIDIVVQFALNKLNFPAERIILYGWSIGGFTGTFIGYLMARRHYWLQY